MAKMYAENRKCGMKIENTFVREFLAEFLGIITFIKQYLCYWNAGTFVLVSFGMGSVAQSALSLQTKGNFLSINWGKANYSGHKSYKLYIAIQLGYRCLPWHGYQFWCIWRPSQSGCISSSCIFRQTFLDEGLSYFLFLWYVYCFCRFLTI